MPPTCGPLRNAFPTANRGAELRKFHLRTFLQRQAEAEVPFATTMLDFQLLLHAAGVLSQEMLTSTCNALLTANAPGKTAREAAAASIEKAHRALCDYAGA